MAEDPESVRITMSSPDLTVAEIDAVTRVLGSKVLSIGPSLVEFERHFAEYVGARYAIGVSSGTAALHLALIACGVVERDLVVTSPFSFVASANCALYEGAIPIFVDVDPTTGNIDPSLVRAALEDLGGNDVARRRWLPPLTQEGPQNFTPKAILPIHAFGQPADMAPIMQTATTFGVTVIEDACEAIGAGYNGSRVGNFGKASCFAFYPNKQMTTGEGGMITTDDERWASLLRSLRNQGRDVFDAWLSHARLGYNYRLNELAAALGLVQLSRLDEMLAKRARVAGWYDDRLRTIEGVHAPSPVATTTRMSWFVYVVRFSSAKTRALVMNALAEREIPSRPYFTPIHLQPFYAERFGYQRGAFPVTEALSDTSLALPFSSVMTEEQVDRVCHEVASILDRGRLPD